jgi:hypothetical protein
MRDNTQGEGRSGSTFSPSEEWIEAFEAQATEGMIERARRYARGQARGVAKAGGVADAFYVSELVQDAVADIMVGTVTWAPEVRSLESLLLDVIRSRARHDRIRARRFRHEALDGARTRRLTAEVESALMAAQSGGEVEDAAEVVPRVLAELRALASGDGEVVALIEAFAAGAISKAEVMTAAGLSARQYKNARQRLLRYVEQLSPAVREAAGAAQVSL